MHEVDRQTCGRLPLAHRISVDICCSRHRLRGKVPPYVRRRADLLIFPFECAVVGGGIKNRTNFTRQKLDTNCRARHILAHLNPGHQILPFRPRQRKQNHPPREEGEVRLWIAPVLRLKRIHSTQLGCQGSPAISELVSPEATTFESTLQQGAVDTGRSLSGVPLLWNRSRMCYLACRCWRSRSPEQTLFRPCLCNRLTLNQSALERTVFL